MMCTIIAKKFPNIGWVGVKNRDRSVATRTKLLRNKEEYVERVTLVDENTKWSEGMNTHGVSIISSSLSTKISAPDHHSKDGRLIKLALSKSTVREAVDYLEKNKICGCVMIFDQNQMFLIEGEENTHKQIVKEIKEDQIARTNHGIWLPKAGYQLDSADTLLKLRRISSEARLAIGNYILSTSNDPYELMPELAKKWTDNNQLTTLRKPLGKLKSRTTEQLMLIPSNKEILLRNTDGVLDFDQKDANKSNSVIQVGIVDE